MKVIVAGYPKTGTKSMNAALTQLGFNVYDALENLVLLQGEYVKILHEGWSTEDFSRMYENVDAVTDMPAAYFWDEIHKAFPDAKIILTLRENEDVWWKSMVNQIKASQQLSVRFLEYFSPTSWKARKEIASVLMLMVFGFETSHPFSRSWRLNEQMAKKVYRTHNANVLRTAPKDKLLVYKCSEGWEPLCKFLDVPVPDRPFPRKNVRGSVYDEMKENAIFQNLQKEVKLSVAKYAVIVGAVALCSYKYGPINLIQAFCDHTKRALEKVWFS